MQILAYTDIFPKKINIKLNKKNQQQAGSIKSETDVKVTLALLRLQNDRLYK